MEKKSPLVSVLMPCYNHEKYVATAIESVLNQTYKNIELIVADNGCTDGSYEIIKRYSERIKIIRLEKNDLEACSGLMFAAANGSYIAHMTSDDYWMPEKIQKQMDVFEKHKDVHICSTWAYFGDEELKYDPSFRNIFMKKNRSRGEWLKRFLTKGNCIAHPSTVLKRDIFQYLNVIARNGYRQLGDLYWWICSLVKGNIHIIEEPLMIFRWHTSNNNCNMSTPSEENAIRDANETASIIENVLENFPNDLFIEAFSDEFVNPDSNTNEEILCEKILLLKKEAEKKAMYQSVYLNFYLKHYKEIEKIIKEKYGFTIYDFWNDSGNMGAAYAWAHLKKEKEKKRNEYVRGVRDTLIALHGDDWYSIDRELLRLLPETCTGFSVIARKAMDVQESRLCRNESYNYAEILSAISEFVQSIQDIADLWELYNIEIDPEDWKLFIELLTMAASSVIDLDEAILPYTDWLIQRFEFCINE